MDNINNQPLQEPNDTVPFAYQAVTEESKSIIKVVGVGGGGSNAVENMYREGAGIQDVSFLIINTDKAALKNSKIPNKLQISEEGLGAGAQPDVAQKYAIESEDAIRNALSDGTKMVFITAGMGGGTGTGASPVVAKIAHELGILTIGIVTIPFKFEGQKKIVMALKGVASIRQYVDALLVVNNNRLIDVYPDFNFFNAFKKADDTLTVAAKSISDIINITGYMNLDFADVEKTLKDSGVALISTGEAAGEGRVTAAIANAVNSPLLQDNQITQAKRLLFELCFSESNPVSMAEIGELSAFVEGLSADIEVIWGAMVDNTLGDDVRMIVLASGFDIADDGTIMASSIKLKSDIEREEKEAAEAAEKKKAEKEAARIAAEEAAEAKKAEEAAAAAKKEEERLAAEKEEAEAAAKKKAEREELENQEALKRQIEELQAKLAAAQKATDTEMDPSKDEPAEAPVAEVATTEVKPEPVAEVQQAETSHAPAVVTEAPATEPNKEVEAPKPQTANSPLEGLESIRRFYGDETADSMKQNNVRSRYYLLDNKDLSNEELISLLEKMPAYNRTAEQFAQLKEVSARGSSAPGRNSNASDGTIQFNN